MQEYSCVGVSFLIKLQASGLRCFPVNFAKFLITPFLQNASWWLLLKKKSSYNLNNSHSVTDKTLEDKSHANVYNKKSWQACLTKIYNKQPTQIATVILVTKKRKPYTLLIFTHMCIRPANSPGATKSLPVLIDFSRFLGLSQFSQQV